MIRRCLLELLLGAQLVAVTALLLPAVLGTGVQASIAPAAAMRTWLRVVAHDRMLCQKEITR